MDFHSFIMIVAISVASNLDNAGVGIAYGVRKIHIPWYANLIIAVISFLATFIGGTFGKWISIWITPFVGNVIGTSVIVLVGVWVLCQPLLEHRASQKKSQENIIGKILKNPMAADQDRSKTIGIGESMLLGTALSLNAIAGGFDAGITKLNILATSLLIGLFSFILILACSYFGEKYAADRLGQKATVISGILLILIGLRQLF